MKLSYQESHSNLGNKKVPFFPVSLLFKHRKLCDCPTCGQEMKCYNFTSRYRCSESDLRNALVLGYPARISTPGALSVQCSAVQCSAVQCSAVQCSAVQCSAVQCSAVRCTLVQLTAVPYKTMSDHCLDQIGKCLEYSWPTPAVIPALTLSQY